MKKNFLYVLFALVTLTLSLPLRAQMRIYSNNIQIAKKSANMFFNTDGKGNWSVVDAKSGAYNANMDVSRIDSISVVDNVIHVTGITLAPSKVQLNEGGKVLIMALMFVGRLGPLTIAVAIARQKHRPAVAYAEEQVMIG